MNQSVTVECAEKNEGYDGGRFALVVYIGTPVAFIGTIFNVQFGAVYMMLCATFERFVYISSNRSLSWFITDHGRLITVIIALLLSLILRIPTFFEYRIVYRANCPPFQDYLFLPVLMSYSVYAKFNFYMMSIVQTILPFILLTCFNIIITYLTHKRLYQASHGTELYTAEYTAMITHETENRKSCQDLKYATRTMVAIVFTYLTCNVFSVFMSVMENIFPESSLLIDKDGSR
uniref:G-protein coupled receptors family 1 profile domain-containing protein n=1 Tax=Setaria digitata TaxID=48799 RepID=A0A915PXG2_9BILA